MELYSFGKHLGNFSKKPQKRKPDCWAILNSDGRLMREIDGRSYVMKSWKQVQHIEKYLEWDYKCGFVTKAIPFWRI
jgi:carboxypeptidase C (cathepsin A)